MCHIRIHGKMCYRKGCDKEVSTEKYAVMIGEDGQLHSYHESCALEEQKERAEKYLFTEYSYVSVPLTT